MSALFNNNAKYLTSVLAAPLNGTAGKLIVAWLRWTRTNEEYRCPLQLAKMAGTNPNRYIRFQTTTNSDIQIAIQYASATSLHGGPLTSDVWGLVGMYLEPHNGIANSNYFSYRGSATHITTAQTGVDADVGTPFAYLTIGNGWNLANATWPGRVAEVSLWTPADKTAAEAIISQLLTKTADNVSGASPVWYAKLAGDASVTTGSALTNVGSVAFDAANHPTLTGPVTTQTAAPTSTISAGPWTAVGAASLHAAIGESVASDAEYATTSSAGAFEVRFAPLSAPLAGTRKLKYRIRSASGGNLSVSLVQNETIVQTWTHTPAPATFTTYEQTISNAITDYTNLRLRCTAG